MSNVQQYLGLGEEGSFDGLPPALPQVGLEVDVGELGETAVVYVTWQTGLAADLNICYSVILVLTKRKELRKSKIKPYSVNVKHKNA